MPRGAADAPRWEQRVARARALAAAHPATAEPLIFYADLATFQQSLHSTATAGAAETAMPVNRYPLAQVLDPGDVVEAIHRLLRWLPSAAPGELAAAADQLQAVPALEWRDRVRARLDDADSPPGGTDPLMTFVVDAALQPFAEAAAIRLSVAADHAAAGPIECPTCGARPLAAVLREEGQGARRSLVCGVCFTEWRHMRLGCLACGEQQFDKLPVYVAEQFPHVRVDACDSCQAYVKTVDLSRDGLAVPEVDDIATIALDLWARDRGYIRLRPHLLAL